VVRGQREHRIAGAGELVRQFLRERHRTGGAFGFAQQVGLRCGQCHAGEKAQVHAFLPDLGRNRRRMQIEMIDAAVGSLPLPGEELRQARQVECIGSDQRWGEGECLAAAERPVLA
jgi:hypothetical protein